jgi:hypothetical protein
MQPCSHALCLDCAKQLVGCGGTYGGVTCPMCRAPISGFGLVPEAAHKAGQRKGLLAAGSGI